MKYKKLDINIPKIKRTEINSKIQHIISNNIDTDITKQEIFNCYSAMGDIVDINFKEYESFNAYTNAKNAQHFGQFFTLDNICKLIVDTLDIKENESTADLTAGIGHLINYIPNQALTYANEVDLKSYRVLKYLYPEANCENNCLSLIQPKQKYDYILGNPPFNLYIGKDKILSQFLYILRAYDFLKNGGFLAIITPKHFLSDEFYYKNMIENINGKFSFMCQLDISKGWNVNIDIKLMFFYKISKNLPFNPYENKYLELTPNTPNPATIIHKTYVYPIKQLKLENKAKIHFENVHNILDATFEFKVKKLLFDMKQNKKTNKYYYKCFNYYQEFLHQTKPDGMEAKDWNRKKITENKVISKFKHYNKKAYEKQIDKIELVKHKYSIAYKAYSNKAKKELKKITDQPKHKIIDLVIHNQPNKYPKFKKCITKKINDYKLSNKKLLELQIDNEIKEYLDTFTFINEKGQHYLNDIQKSDINKIIQKNRSILNYQQGTGKTPCGYAYLKYKQQKHNIKFCFILSSPIAIKQTWTSFMKYQNETYVLLRKNSQLENIHNNSIILLPSSMLGKLKKRLKRFIKINNNKILILVDESHMLSNKLTQATKNTLASFRRCNWKLLMTGTVTKNSVNEIYSQLEILYNNSYNMIDTCEKRFQMIKQKDIGKTYVKEKPNPNQMKPYSAYFGNKIFSECFSPLKQTVFGVMHNTQSIYNSESLIHMLQKTIISKSFYDIVGSKKHKIHNTMLIQNQHEIRLYHSILNEFISMIEKYFATTGNDKKDNMLRIIRQLQLLMKASSYPLYFDEFNNNTYEKQKWILDFIENNNTRIAIGTIYKQTAKHYKNIIRNRPVFFVESEISFDKRIDIINNFRLCPNGILISTQQCLSESVNIPECNHVIVESLQWNIPRISQYYFRFIRFDSEKDTNVYLLNYINTIDQNLLGLLMGKENINNFIKTCDLMDNQELLEEFDLNIGIFQYMIQKINKDGKSWLQTGR